MDSYQKPGTSMSSPSSRSQQHPQQQPQHPQFSSSGSMQLSGASSVDSAERGDTQSPRRKLSPAENSGAAPTSHSPHQQQPPQQAPFSYHSPAFVVQPHLESFMRQQQEFHHIAQMQNQMIQLGGAHPLQHVSGIHMQQYEFFPQGLLTGAPVGQVHRAEDMQRATSYPISTVFPGNDDRFCCLVDRGVRCNRTAGMAGFTHRIRELVARNGALLTEDSNAGHQYICDHHKNYIQKLRAVMPAGNGQGFVSPFVNPTGNIQSVFSQYPVDSPFIPSPAPLVQQQIPNHGASKFDQSLPAGDQDRDRPSRTNNASPQKAHTVTDSRVKDENQNNAPVDMRKVQAQDIRAVTTSTSPETEPSESSEEEYDGGPAPADLLYALAESFSLEELVAYLKQFEIEVPPRCSKEDMTKIVSEHMDSVPVTDVKTSLLSFFHAVKTDTRPFSQPYKSPLNADFDLSSDEEMLLMDGNSGVIQADSSDDEVMSNDEGDTHQRNGVTVPEIRSDPEVERALNRITGKVTAEDIERILDKYSLPSKFSRVGHDSDSESFSSGENKNGERENRRKRKQRNRVE